MQSSAASATSPTASTTPSLSTPRQGSTAASTSTTSPRPSSLHDDSVPKEGLNGSNVPGLPPPANTMAGGEEHVVHSNPDSRRTSGMPADMSADDQFQLGANRRSINGSVNDMATSFDRMGLAQSAANKAHQQRQQHQQQQTPSRAVSGGAAGMFGTAASGQQSLLQRAMGQSTPQPAAQEAQLHQQPGFNAGEANLTPVFNERFLFSDDELEADDSTFVRKYNLNEDDNSFPVLIRHDSHPGMLSASSAALDLAPLSQTPPRFPRGEGSPSEWPRFNRDSAGNDVNGGSSVDGGVNNTTAGTAATAGAAGESYDRYGPRRGGRSERNSPRIASGQAQQRGGHHLGPAPGAAASMSVGGRSNDSAAPRSASSSQFGSASGPRASGGAPQGFHDRSTDDALHKDAHHARASRNQDGKVDGNKNSGGFAPFAGMGGGFGGAEVKNAQGRYPASYGFDGRGQGGNGTGDVANRNPSGYFEAFAAPPAGSKAPATGQKLGNNFGIGADAGPAAAGLNGMKVPRKGELDTNTPLEELQGEIFALCKDQHGCRYLQKKLEEGNSTYRDMIFTETFSHFAELMTDPFGNYLCQKMLEFCTDEQRNLIVESVAPDLVGISLNMHGTRAVQKTIDFLSTPRQIHSIIMALGMNVVPLIKDLNGNHVIQKCLNRLGSADNQFIYDAVATHCVEVATHRHGCCVLQRCIDHASDKQRMQLVQEITFHALTLVQDPFGNYVVQYILDLNDPRYSEALVRQFLGHVCNLSVQKFSSNVIEKCIRVSEPATRKQLVEELLNRTRLEKLLRDSFANYVVQTSLDYSDPVQRMQLVECIKPILPMIRNTPYGKRIQSKLQRDNIDLGPSPNNLPYGMMQAAHQQQLQAMAAMAHRQGPGGGGAGGAPGGPGDYGTSAVGNAAGPYGSSYMNGPGNGGAGNPRNYTRQNMGHLPPPQVAAMYGGGGRGGGYGGGAAGFGVANGNGGNHNAASAYGRPPHSMGGFTPSQSQQQQQTAYVQQQNNYAAAGSASPFHAGAQYGGQF